MNTKSFDYQGLDGHLKKTNMNQHKVDEAVKDRELEKIRGHCRKTYTNLEHHAENEKRFGKKTLWYKIKRLFKSK